MIYDMPILLLILLNPILSFSRVTQCPQVNDPAKMGDATLRIDETEAEHKCAELEGDLLRHNRSGEEALADMEELLRSSLSPLELSVSKKRNLARVKLYENYFQEVTFVAGSLFDRLRLLQKLNSMPIPDFAPEGGRPDDPITLAVNHATDEIRRENAQRVQSLQSLAGHISELRTELDHRYHFWSQKTACLEKLKENVLTAKGLLECVHLNTSAPAGM